MTHTSYIPGINAVKAAQQRIHSAVSVTPLEQNRACSELYQAEVLLKREDLHQVRSYKIRGSYNKICALMRQQAGTEHVVCASAGNHAQGVAFTCSQLGIKATVFMPTTTPRQKVEQVRMFGRDYIDTVLIGDTFDAANAMAQNFCQQHGYAFVHPFDDPDIIEGQATIGLELLQQNPSQIDYVFVPVGGGGLASGIAAIIKQLSPHTQVIGVEPKGAPSMSVALQQGHPVKLEHIDRFVDGAAVQQVGNHTLSICQQYLDDVITVDEGHICQTLLNLYSQDAIVVEPAGALSVAGLAQYQQAIRGKRVVCIISGSNNDITRIEDIREKALLYSGLKHYFIVQFPQRAGALKEFVGDILGPKDDITYFQYQKKNNREHGPAVIGIEIKRKQDFDPLLSKMKSHSFSYQYLNDKPELFSMML